MANNKTVGSLKFDKSHSIGKGRYGIVYKGIYGHEYNGFVSGKKMPVAVKRLLIDHVGDSTQLRQEVENMKKAGNHLNILRCIHTETDCDFL